MFSKNFRLFLRSGLRCASILVSTPFSYSWKHDRLSCHGLGLPIYFIQALIIIAFAVHYDFQVLYSLDILRENISDLSVHIFYTVCWNLFILYHWKFWTCRKEICWLYNQVSAMNGT